MWCKINKEENSLERQAHCLAIRHASSTRKDWNGKAFECSAVPVFFSRVSALFVQSLQYIPSHHFVDGSIGMDGMMKFNVTMPNIWLWKEIQGETIFSRIEGFLPPTTTTKISWFRAFTEDCLLFVYNFFFV